MIEDAFARSDFRDLVTLLLTAACSQVVSEPELELLSSSASTQYGFGGKYVYN